MWDGKKIKTDRHYFYNYLKYVMVLIREMLVI